MSFLAFYWGPVCEAYQWKHKGRIFWESSPEGRGWVFLIPKTFVFKGGVGLLGRIHKKSEPHFGESNKEVLYFKLKIRFFHNILFLKGWLPEGLFYERNNSSFQFWIGFFLLHTGLRPVQTLTRVSISRNSRREITNNFLTWSWEMNLRRFAK